MAPRPKTAPAISPSGGRTVASPASPVSVAESGGQASECAGPARREADRQEPGAAGDFIATTKAEFDRVKCLPQGRGSFRIGGKRVGPFHGDIGDHPGAEDEGGPDQSKRPGDCGGVGQHSGDLLAERDDQNNERQRVDDVDQGVPGDQYARPLGDESRDGSRVDLVRPVAQRGEHGDKKREPHEVGCGAGQGGEASGLVESHVRGP